MLEHEEIAVLHKNQITIQNLNGDLLDKEIQTSEMDITDIQKGGYEHFMLKEIHEEPDVVKKTIDSLMQNNLLDLLNTMPNLKQYDQIHIIACGSAMYASKIEK